MLQNRGYVQFVDNDLSKISDLSQNNSQTPTNGVVQPFNRDIIDNSRKDIDYIEQGACVLDNDVKKKIDNNSKCVSDDPSKEELPILASIVPKTVIENKIDEKLEKSLNDSEHEKDQENFDHDDDSLVLVESAADTTTSDLLTIVSTPMETPTNPDKTWTNDVIVKDKTDNIVDTVINKPIASNPNNNNENKNIVNDKFGSTWKTDENSKAYDEYIKTLKERVAGFGNIRDSIDIRKSRRKSKSNINITADNLNEVDEVSSSSNKVPALLNNKNLSLTQNKSYVSIDNNFNSPATSRKLEEITKERVKQKDLIHDLVMDKLQNKKMLNAEKRLNRSRTRSSFSPGSGYSKPEPIVNPPFKKSSENIEAKYNRDKENACDKSIINNQKPLLYGLQKSPTDSAIIKPSNSGSTLYQLSSLNSPMKHLCGLQHAYPSSVEPDSLVINDKITSTPLTSFKKLSQYKSLRPISMHSSFKLKPTSKDTLSSSLPDTPLTNPEAFSMPDITKKLTEDLFRTPVAPPRLRREDEARKTAEKLRQEAKLRAHMKSNEDLGLSPEDKYQMLKQKINRRQAEEEYNDNNSGKIEHVTTTYKPFNDHQNYEGGLRPRTKSVHEMNRPSSTSTVYSSYSHDSAKDKSIESSTKGSGFCTSDPNMSCDSPKSDSVKKVKTKDRERRKSIIQAVSDFFHKRISHSNPTSPIKDGKDQGIYSSQKSRDKSKSCFDMDHLNSFENYKFYQLLYTQNKIN